MPTYDYACEHCGGFDAHRTVAERNDAALCPDCRTPSPRVMVGAPRLALRRGDTRSAMDTHERARPDPKTAVDYQRLKHPGGCGCCATGKRGATGSGAHGAPTFPSKIRH
jgi:putative FmdB family regulatory protein